MACSGVRRARGGSTPKASAASITTVRGARQVLCESHGQGEEGHAHLCLQAWCEEGHLDHHHFRTRKERHHRGALGGDQAREVAGPKTLPMAASARIRVVSAMPNPI